MPLLRDVVGARKAVYGGPDEQVTAAVDVRPWTEQKIAAVLAHHSGTARPSVRWSRVCGGAGSPAGGGIPAHPVRPIEPRDPYRSFTRVVGAAGLRVIRLHDARHGRATLLTAAGVPPRVVMEVLGRRRIAVTMNSYAHVVRDTRREAVSHLDRMVKRQRPDRG